MSLLSFLHPLWKRSLNEYDDSVNSAVIGALNQSLSKSEEDMVQSKVESYLSTADAKWLDYWGYWFGERRKSGWSDDYYRSRIVNHVEHARGTVDALRNAIADFINTNKDNIYIYEPYRDMFIWNSSKYNTNKYFSSTYYRYAVIDIQISASYPKEIVSIINLFRPAGVLWVLTETVNSRNSDAPIIDIKNPKDAFVPKIENDFIFGLRKRTRLVINPSKDEYETVTNPLTYNKKDSLFNNRDSLFMGATQISKRYSFVGQSLFDYTPDDNDTLEDASYNVEQLSNSDIASVSTKNGRGKTFDFNPIKDNLINNASNYLAQTDITSYSDKYSMPTDYLKEGKTYNFAININSNTSFPNTKTDLILDSESKNLLLDTEFNDLPTYWTSRAGTVTGTFNGHNVIYYDATKITYDYIGVLQQPIYDPTLTTNRVLPSHWYTLSFYVKGSRKITTYVYPDFVDTSVGCYLDGVYSRYAAPDGSNVWGLTDGWERHTYTFKSKPSFPDNGTQNVLWRLYKGNEAYVCMPKLERGTIATPYSIAPEDNPDETSTTQIKKNLATLVKNGNQWLTTQFTIPEGFNLDTGPYLAFSGSDSKVDFNVSKPIIKNSLNTNLMSWAQSADEETNTPTKLADVIDLKGFINDNYKTLGTTVTNKELNDLFDTKKLHLVIRTVNAPSDSLTIKFFNFNNNLWVTYGKFDIAGSYTDIFVKLDDITPLMNEKSLMYVSIEFSNDRSIAVNLDYIGLSLSNSEDGYSIKMFADQSPYGIESQSVMGPFTISKSSVSRAYISPSE